MVYRSSSSEGKRLKRKARNARWDILSQGRELLPGKWCVMGGWEASRRTPGPCVYSLHCLFWKRCGKLNAEFKHDFCSYDSLKKSLSASSTPAFFQRSCLHTIYKVITCSWKFLWYYLEMSGRAVPTISLCLPLISAYVLIQWVFIVLRAKKGFSFVC